MKPRTDGLVVVTATTDLQRGWRALAQWRERSSFRWQAVLVLSGATEESAAGSLGGETIVMPVLGFGSVPAFAAGVRAALELTPPASVIACLHDDVEILEDDWDGKVESVFAHIPTCGLLGFGGGTGLGANDIYQTSYDPMQLARQDFVSNMKDAEAHGRRAAVVGWASTASGRRPIYNPEPVACLDGFSQIGRREFWIGMYQPLYKFAQDHTNLFQRMTDLGIVHHCYDAALGGYAARHGWQSWMLPIACHHRGGETAVLDERYHAWAREQHPDGDHHFWRRAHEIVYEEFRDVLPLRVVSSHAPYGR